MPTKTFFNLPEQKRDALIQAAFDEFSNLDYNSASISRIVRELDIAKGSFYQYFQDKKDLYLYLLNLVSEAKLTFLQKTPPLKENMDFYEYLNWLFQVSIDFDKTHPVYSRLAYRAFYGNSSIQDVAIDEIKQASAKFIRKIVIQGVKQGDIDSHLDLDLVVFTTDTLINAFNHYIPQKLGVNAEILASQNSSILDRDLATDIYSQLVDILKFGLAERQKID
jgi:AcrR family transcriptional regulator